MKTYKIQEIKGRYFATLPIEIVNELNLKKGDLLKFEVINDENEQPAIPAILIKKEEIKLDDIKTAMPEVPQPDAIQSQEGI